MPMIHIYKTIDGKKVLNNVSFMIRPKEKVAFVGKDEIARTTLFQILMGEMEPDEGTFKWGVTTKTAYFPKDNNEYFDGCKDSLIEWLRPYGFVSAQVDEVFRSLTGESGRRFSNGAWELLKDRDILLLRSHQLEGEDKCRLSVHQVPAEVPLAQGSILVVNRFFLSPDYQISRMANVATLDAAQVEFPLTIRPWQMGDKFAPFGMKGKKKLVSDLLTDLKLSRFEKEAQLIVADARGRILWVVGRRTDERARVTEQTKKIIEIRLNSVNIV